MEYFQLNGFNPNILHSSFANEDYSFFSLNPQEFQRNELIYQIFIWDIYQKTATMDSNAQLFSTLILGNTILKNRVVMAPMTRSRATVDHIPTEIMATYYAQRSGAGLIITEGTAPSPNGVGYTKIPGIYNDEQVKAWKKITSAVHDEKGAIFIQLMHTGRVSHPDNMPDDAEIVAPSEIAPENTKMYVPEKGELEIPVPKEMTVEDISNVVDEYVTAAQNAMRAGFDGVEIHGANGYLLEQFVNTNTNKRDDFYGGSKENRCRLILKVAEKVMEAVGPSNVGIRLSPNGALNDCGPFEGQEETYQYLAGELNAKGLAYVHLVNHESMGAPALPENIRNYFRDNFKGTLILSGGYDKEQAEEHLQENLGDLVAFGRPYIANPDLVQRFKEGAKLSEPNQDLFYSGGEEGYIDYPTLAFQKSEND